MTNKDIDTLREAYKVLMRHYNQCRQATVHSHGSWARAAANEASDTWVLADSYKRFLNPWLKQTASHRS